MSTHRENLRNKVLAGITGGGLAKPMTPVRSTAYLAQVTESVKEGFAKKVERLEAERAAGGVVLKLDPKRVGESAFANRHDRSLDPQDPAMQALINDIRTRGQSQPIVVRPAPKGAPVDYEIIFGHRRHAACLALDAEKPDGQCVLALLDAGADEVREHVIKMYQENAAREDLSAFETGAMFANWLSAGVFRSQTAIGEALQIAQATVARYVAIAALPEDVLEAFGDPRVISMRWGEQLGRVLNDRESAVLAVARDLSQRAPRLAPEAVLQALLAAGAPKKARVGAIRTETVKHQGRTLYKIAPRGNGLQISFGPKLDPKLAKAAQDEVKEALSRVLTQAVREPGR